MELLASVAVFSKPGSELQLGAGDALIPVKEKELLLLFAQFASANLAKVLIYRAAQLCEAFKSGFNS